MFLILRDASLLVPGKGVGTDVVVLYPTNASNKCVYMHLDDSFVKLLCLYCSGSPHCSRKNIMRSVIKKFWTITKKNKATLCNYLMFNRLVKYSVSVHSVFFKKNSISASLFITCEINNTGFNKNNTLHKHVLEWVDASGHQGKNFGFWGAEFNVSVWRLSVAGQKMCGGSLQTRHTSPV